MLHTNNPIIKHKAGLLNLAQELNNVSKACKVMGVSRDTFYRYQELVAEGGVDAFIDKNRRAPNLKTVWMKPSKKRLLIMLSNIRLMASTEPVMSYVSKACSSLAAVCVLSGYGTIWRTLRSV